ncbi:ABC transporter permease [candidate division KSB1 bacterium]
MVDGMTFLTIALNTFKETVRDKVLYSFLLFALGFAIVSAVISTWSLSQEEKIIQDFGLVIVTVFSLLISIFIGIGLVYKEEERRTIYSILSKPISRGSFIIGKYSGLLLTMLIIIALMAFVMLFLTFIFTGAMNFKLLLAAGMLFFIIAIIIAFALLFSTLTSPVISGILTVFMFVTGNFAADIKVIGPGIDSGLFSVFVNLLYYIVPNFELLNYQLAAVHDLPVEPMRVFTGIIYAVAYSGALILITILMFKNRDLK